MTRRDVLKMTASAAVATLSPALGTTPVVAQQSPTNNESWRFICVNDLHYDEAACGPWFDQIVAAMKASAPDARFCLLAGDLADDGKDDQLAGIHKAFQGLGIPVYASPGNHDHLTDTDRTAYEKYFPGQINQVFEHGGWQIMGLDTSDGTRYKDTKIHQATLDWLDTTLPTLDKAKPTLIWTHFPLGEGVNYRPQNADALLGRLAPLNIQAIFSGHWHGLTEKTWHNATCTTDKCCSRVRSNHDGTKDKGWFICTVRAGKLTREFVEIPAALR